MSRRRCWFAGLALALCTATAPASNAPWVLRGDGLSRTGEGGKAQVLRFGTPRSTALAAVTAVLGRPLSTRTVPDCGQGEPMVLAAYKGDLTIQFLKGRFSGWSLDAPGDRRLRTAAGLTIGSPRTAVLKAYPDATIDDGPLGVMFDREQGPSGFLDSMEPGARVIGLYAGETCMIS